ncbi:hypothetical protein K466DRAFT_604308 [Polyporus arcularius HHB13444]|uniref:Uncharacterized protein n=1 Tax=Polyporus arcularius HHB13444 TaxID=1314778 RepID=A0A5C3NWE2_9APHY|nr:hypothetical protein K466DRAFT_604308 [Polyporus arcularius HHB13444]
MYLRGRSVGALDYRPGRGPLLLDVDEPLDEAVPRCIQRELLVLRQPVGVDAFFRIDTFARFRKPRCAIYSLGYVPVEATWGTGGNSRLLCDSVGPVDIWVVGCLERFQYTTDISVASIDVRVALLRECDRTRMTNLLRRTSPKTRVEDVESATTLTASVEYPGKALVFRSVYDGTVTYEAAALMKRMCVTDLCPGDYVLVECMLVRTVAPADGSWSVKFQLCSLSLLSGAARAGVPERDSGFRGEM